MSSRFRIADLTLDTGRRLLLCDSKPIALGPLTYRLLLTLVEAAPNVVSQDQLIAAIWDGRPVSPETISQRIKLLRDALADDPHHPRYVELVRGQGYRLVPPVELLPSESIVRHRSRWVAPTGIALSLVVAAMLVVWIARAPTRSMPERNSIAVLPFVDLSPEQDQQYLADGIAEEILTLLSTSTTLRVIARTSSFSFRGKDAGLARIAQALDVTHVLEGSVRKAGTHIRIAVRLVDASTGSRLWSESYDRDMEDILALQADVARSIAVELNATLRYLADVPATGVNPAAYDLYLRGQHELRAFELGTAIGHFQQAIAIDSDFIPAYCSLGLAYVHEVVDVQVPMTENRERLRELVGRGLRLAPNDPGLLALSAQLARYDGSIKLAEQRFAMAEQRDPSNRVLRIVYPEFKIDQGHPQEALALIRRAHDTDPLNPPDYVAVWASYMDLGNAREAIAAAEHYREIAVPADPASDGLIAVTELMLSGDLVRSIAHNNRALARVEPHERIPPWLPQLYYVIGDLRTAESLMERIRPTSRSEHEMVPAEAYGHLVAGDVEGARRLALATMTAPEKTWRGEFDVIPVRLTVDAMIAHGEPRRAVEFLEKLAPEYARYKVTKDMDPQDFAPASVPVKSAFSSYPALYFTDYARALRATGDEAGANQMLDHLEAILDLRRKRGLFIEERYVAEALALRGKTAAALDALEKAERERTIYHCWHFCLLHNEIFAEFRNHPRFVALVEKIQSDLGRQRDQLRQNSHQ